MDNIMTINGKTVTFDPNAKNLLEVIRQAGIDLPTFCYHSELSIYGACRLCIVDIEGQGIQASCSVKPVPGMIIRTHTDELREMRKMTLELLLAAHQTDCPVCDKQSSCRLKELSSRMGVVQGRFKPSQKNLPVDKSAYSLLRNPNKCILCGDCVRACKEIQGIGVLDFIGRGKDVVVAPVFNKNIAEVECVHCGQCAAVCPTGAITIRSEVEEVWAALNNPRKTVIAQIAPAVRVALGEAFGTDEGTVVIGQLVAALKKMGFARVYDTAFAADLTVMEEGAEFLHRLEQGERLPQFTSCCPAWIRYAEQFHPDLLDNLSTCKSPQQMMGSLLKEFEAKDLGIDRRDLVVVSIMPCTAKKEEARREEFIHDGNPDVDYVLTTVELASMIREMGFNFAELEPESLDLPYGFKTGAGILFGASGGVGEAVVRYLAYQEGIKDPKELITVEKNDELIILNVRLKKRNVRIGAVSGLKRAEAVIEKIQRRALQLDLVEIMACPGGCIGGAGQPVSAHQTSRVQRARAIGAIDKTLQLHRSPENPSIQKLYHRLEKEGDKDPHRLFHTFYRSRSRIQNLEMEIHESAGNHPIPVSVCVGTSCYLKGSQNLLHKIIREIEQKNWKNYFHVKATFCYERCDRGPTVRIGDTLLEHCTPEKVLDKLEKMAMETVQGKREE